MPFPPSFAASPSPASRCVRSAHRLLCVLAVAMLPASPRLRAGEPAADAGGTPSAVPVESLQAESFLVEVEQPDGTAVSGRLVRIDGSDVTVEVSGEPRVLPIDKVRRLVRTQRTAEQRRPLLLTWNDGSSLAGDDFAWDGKTAVLLRSEGRVELPIGRVRSLAWNAPGSDSLPIGRVRSLAWNAPGSDSAEPRWTASIPESIESDLVVVRGAAAGEARPGAAGPADAGPADAGPGDGRPGDGAGGSAEGGSSPFDFVECAIASVAADRVTVVLDGETIPVKRAKILGLHWLRDAAAAAAGGIRIDVDGGSLRAQSVAWTPEGLVVDDAVRMPAAMLQRIDYAAGRMVSLESLPTERLEVEPWFGGLGKIDGLSAFFAPRAVPAAGEWQRPGLVMRPRTVAVWRLPADGRRFRAVVSPAAGKQAAGGAMVALAVDDREVFRRQIDATTMDGTTIDGKVIDGKVIDLDISGGRRLVVTVDFCGPGGTNAAIRFTDPVIEK